MHTNYYIAGLWLLGMMTSCTTELEADIEALENENAAIRTEIEALLDTEITAFDPVIEGIDESNAALDQLLFAPLQATHTYTYDGQTTLTDIRKFGFTSQEYQYLEQQSDPDIYKVYVYMWENTDEDETMRVSFNYNIQTQAVTDIDYKLEYYDSYGSEVYITDNNEDYYEESDEVTLEISKVDPEAGETAFVLTLDYSENSRFSTYGHAGQVVFSFDGKLQTYVNLPTTEVPLEI